MELWIATKLAFKQYTTFTGRSNRADYWYFILALVIATAVLGVFSDELARVLSIITLLPWLAASARRLRDAGLSMNNFWWLVLPVVGWIIWIVQLAQPSRD